MYKINEIKVKIEENDKEKLKDVLARFFCVDKAKIVSYKILKRSLDARRKTDIHYKYNFAVEFASSIEREMVDKFKLVEYVEFCEETKFIKTLKTVVVVGSGPSGLFSALELAKSGVHVVLLERGESVENRVKTVETFLNGGKFNRESNIQFGEGGAGTFSDGKLNTGINNNLVNHVLKTFYKFGAEETVLYDSKPHVGTDYLRKVVVNMRKHLISLGAEIKFNTKFDDFKLEGKKIKVEYSGKENGFIYADDLILALGYSARDTLRHLYIKGIKFKQKPFSVGFRIEHLQKEINKAQYGEKTNKLLPSADYKLFTHLDNGRTVYTFCMCPGGEVVPAMSEEGQIVTNGMSFHARDKANANSAVLVSVGIEDFKSTKELAGMDFQEELEKNAFKKGEGTFVVSKVGDFLLGRTTTKLGNVQPTIKPGYRLGNVGELLPESLSQSLRDGIKLLGKKLKGFDNENAVLTGIETRSSAPFAILRNENLCTSIDHIYAVGEGAGMAGGIVSSAVDGIKIAKQIINYYLREEKNEDN